MVAFMAAFFIGGFMDIKQLKKAISKLEKSIDESKESLEMLKDIVSDLYFDEEKVTAILDHDQIVGRKVFVIKNVIRELGPDKIYTDNYRIFSVKGIKEKLPIVVTEYDEIVYNGVTIKCVDLTISGKKRYVQVENGYYAYYSDGISYYNLMTRKLKENKEVVQSKG